MEKDCVDLYTIRGQCGLLKWQENQTYPRSEEDQMLDGQQPAEHHGLTDEDMEGMPQGNEPIPFNGIKASDIQVGGKHYKSMAIQPSEFIYRNELNWLEGNAIKYICRHARKHGRGDIDKAIHYLELLKEWHYDEA